MDTETLAPELPKVLLPGEADQLAQCETTIQRGLAVFYEVGSALAAIRDKRLYRAEFRTFEEYCAARWGMNASRARQLCGAANVVIALGQSVTSGNTSLVLPANERQIRPLLKLPESERTSAWHEAFTTAPGGVVTGAHVERIVLARLGQTPAPSPSTPEAPETQPEPKPDRYATPIGKEARLREAVTNAEAAARELVTVMGTPDSGAAMQVVGMLEALQDYKLHLERVGKLHDARK